MELTLGGEGIDITISEISSDLFLDLLSNSHNHDPGFMEWKLVEDQLLASRIYSNSNPLNGYYCIECDGKEIPGLGEVQTDLSTKVVCKTGSFYLVSVADSQEENWHFLNVETELSASLFRIAQEDIRLSPRSDISFSFIERILYADEVFNSRDASSVWPASYLVVDCLGHIYSLARESTYSEGWEKSSLTLKAISNLSLFIDRAEHSTSLLGSALFLRGRLYWQQGQIEHAIADLGKVDADSNYYIDSRILLAETCIARSEHASALARLDPFVGAEDISVFPPEKLARIFQLRGVSNTALSKPALAISNFKEAVRLFTSALEFEIELADCKFELALLTEKYTGRDATSVFCESLSTNPGNITKLEEDRIKRILLSGKLSYSALVELAAKAVLSEGIGHQEVSSKLLMEESSESWDRPASTSSIDLLHEELVSNIKWFTDNGVSSILLDKTMHPDGIPLIVLEGKSFKSTLDLCDGFMSLSCGFTLTRFNSTESFRDLVTYLSEDSASHLETSIYRLVPDSSAIVFEKHIWTIGSPSLKNICTQIASFVESVEAVGPGL